MILGIKLYPNIFWGFFFLVLNKSKNVKKKEIVL